MTPAVIGKSTEVRPAGTMTVAGAVRAKGALEVNSTGVPPAGAALLSRTVQLALVFDVSVVAVQVSDDGPGALPIIEIITALLLAPRETVTVFTWFVVRVPAVNWKLVVVAPAETVVVPGKVSRPAMLADTARSVPPAGAAFESVAVQLVELEDIRVVLAQPREVRVNGAVIVRATTLLEPLSVAVIAGVWSTITAAAVATKVAVMAVAGTVTDAGTVKALVTLLERATADPPVGAALESVMVQFVVAEGSRVAPVHWSELRVIGGAVIVSPTDLLEALRVAVIVGVWSAVTAAAVAVKAPVVVPAATVMEAGTVTAEVAVLERATVDPPLEAAFERVTVHAVVEDAARVVALHCNEVGVGDATSDKLAVALTPFQVAVAVAA